jgi:hypothetical protein
VLAEASEAVADAFFIDQSGKVVPNRQPEFRLVIQFFQYREIGLNALRKAIEICCFNTGALGCRLKARQAALKFCLRLCQYRCTNQTKKNGGKRRRA